MRVSLLADSVLYPLAGQAGVAENVHSSAGNVRVTENIQTQTALRVRAANARHFDRANLAAEVSFDTVRTFATIEAAEAWAMDYSETFPREGTLIIDSSERNGYASEIQVAGTLTDGTDPVVFADLAYAGIADGRPSFGAALVATCRWYNDLSIWALIDIASGATWESADDVASPELATTWTPASVETGTPIVTATYPARRYMANAIVHPPDRSIIGVAVLLSYRVTGGAIVDTIAEADDSWQDFQTFGGDNWED